MLSPLIKWFSKIKNILLRLNNISIYHSDFFGLNTSRKIILNKSKKLFAHIDCDSFFAECEIYKNPKLKNEYVIVWNEIVIACNYKTKAFWIKTWTPVWKAKYILKGQWVYLEWDHRYYTFISE